MGSTATERVTTFQIGTTYTTGEGRDYVWRFVVIHRSPKFVTLQDIATGENRRVGVWLSDGAELALPLGNYSMAPSIDARRVYAGQVRA
jgi:hypothetical protein